MRNKILSLLVLLLTAATGAWAQEPVAKDIVVSPESGTNINDAIKDALGTNGDRALNITINLAKGGTYTVTETIVPSASITINGNGATIDASGLTNHFIKMSKTPSDEYKVESGQYIVTTPSKIENVTITGLTKALFYDSGTQYVFKDFTFNNCLINYSEQGSLIISLAASMVINFTITNSTFYCKDKAKCTANCIAMSGKRPWQVTGFEDKEGKLLVDHNTFYNVAYKKQFFNTNTLKGQNKYKYEFNSNIFVNVSNKKIYYNLTNNKNQVTTDGLNTYIWDDTFFSETNYNGDEGLKSDPSFKDVENGDFTLDRSSLQYKNNTGDPLWFNPKVTINDNQTEASFEMPTSDVTVNYELVRDMQDETNPVAFTGLPSSGNIVVKKGDGGTYQPAEALTIQLIDPLAAEDAKNIIAADGITIKVLVGAENGQGAIDYDQDNPITLDAFLADMKPGYYWIKAESTDENSPYDGTVYSSEFTVVEKYDLTVKPANDFSKGKIDKVVVGTEEITPDANTGEATKTGIAPETEVKVKAKRGYKIKSATAKQKEGETTVTVTINDTKTEASFDIPTFDVDFSYELVRDMSVDMPVTVQDAEQNSRFRVKKQGDTFVPADMNMEQIVALFTVHDDIEEKNLTANTDYTVQLFAVNEEGQKTGEAIPFNDFTFAPGNYVATAVAASNSNYSGETALSNTFKLFQGYEVTVPAGEYISYYQSEALYVEDEDAVLYTIANVTATEAQLSDAIKVAPAETPLLVYNKSEQNKTFLLIPTTENADEVTPAKEFKGSLTEGEIPASSAVTDYYALNGKAFVWVKYAIEIGANKCWLQIGDQPAAARAMTRSIVGGGDTTNMDDVRWQMEDGNYYDLQGRKVEKPNRKGIYIKGGKKVIVR